MIEALLPVRIGKPKIIMHTNYDAVYKKNGAILFNLIF